MEKPVLKKIAWIIPANKADIAEGLMGMCSLCYEIIAVAKVGNAGQDTELQTRKMLNEAFDRHIEIKHS
jgi:hypothetical protein